MIDLMPMMQNIYEMSKLYVNIKWLILTQRELKKTRLGLAVKCSNKRLFFFFKIFFQNKAPDINNFYVIQVLPADEKGPTHYI